MTYIHLVMSDGYGSFQTLATFRTYAKAKQTLQSLNAHASGDNVYRLEVESFSRYDARQTKGRLSKASTL